MKGPAKKTPISDCDIMLFIIDKYGPDLRNASALIRVLRTKFNRSFSEERFKAVFNRYLKEYAPEELIKK